MTATTIPAVRESRRARPVPVTRLTWVTWRQHRAALAGAGALLGVIAVYLLIMGRKIHDAYDALIACHPAGSASCAQLAQVFGSYYGSKSGPVASSGLNAQTVPFLLLAVPMLLGTFVGAPLLARELESGTVRFAWTQGTGRIRWALTRVLPVALVLTAAAEGLSLLSSWYITPFVEAGTTGKFPMQVFGSAGVAFAAWTLFSFALAAFLGVVFRRTVVAMAVALAAGTVLDMVTMMVLRQHYQAPVVTTGPGPGNPGDWVLGSWFTTASGQQVSLDTLFGQAAQGYGGQGYGEQGNGDMPFTGAQFNAWLAHHHYTQWWSYQPASHWWTFQLIEGGWLLGVSMILIAATVWLVHRRSA